MFTIGDCADRAGLLLGRRQTIFTIVPQLLFNPPSGPLGFLQVTPEKFLELIGGNYV